MRARKTATVAGAQLTVTTQVWIGKARGEWVWRAVLPEHRRLELYLLARAARRSAGWLQPGT